MHHPAASDSLHATCASCGQAVRIPAARLREGPRCPSCKNAILSTSPIELDDQSFDRFLARNDLPVLVDFWAPWCGPCRAFAPVIEDAARTLATQVRVVKVNSDLAPTVSQRLQIRSIPTVAVFRSGTEVARQSGAMPARALSQWLRVSGVIDQPSA